MDSYNNRSHSRSGRVKQKLDRLAHLAELDPRIEDHTTALLDYHESEATDAYPLFNLDDIAHMIPDIVASDPKLAAVMDYVREAESPAIACLMAAIKQRIDEFTERAMG